MNVLFAVHDWGLGHATRDLLLIRGLLSAGHCVHILSHGRALQLLRMELGDSCAFTDLPDIPKPLGRRATTFYVKMSLALPVVFWTYRQEYKCVRDLCRIHHIDRVISDSRVGAAVPEVPSYQLFHSLRQIIPGRPRLLEQLVEASQKRLFACARKILVPDQEVDGLAGDLCHDLACDWRDRIEYIGILSSVRAMDTDRDIDCFISISGAEPQRSLFEEIVLRQVKDLRGRIVVALGRPEREGSINDDGRFAIHGFMNRRQQEVMLNRARLVVTRSGYTTLMELAEIGGRALLVPTVGQSEQEYLADYHKRMGHCYSVRQQALVLSRDTAIAETYPGLPPMDGTQQSVRRFLDAI